jgi:hypothetical protein
MSPAGFKPAIPASERPQTHRSTTGIGYTIYTNIKFIEQINGCLSYSVDTLLFIFIYETDWGLSVKLEYPNMLECNLLAELSVRNRGTWYMTV